MHRARVVSPSLVAVACLATSLVVWTPPARAAGASASLPLRRGYVDLCPIEAGGRRCDTKIVTDEQGVPIHSMAGPVGGFAPADLESAYGLPTTGGPGAGKIVAIFGGGSDYPNAERDLGVYRAQYGLPPCTTANGCFLKIDEHGGTSYPSAGTDEVEQALDMEMVSAGCPACKVMLIEGGDLDVALATVIAKGASALSFSILYSYGSDMENGVQCHNLGYDAPGGGLLITAAMGDSGYPGSARWVPAACQGTLAIGGTSLTKASNRRGWSETTWSGTGSGCGTAVNKPAWQNDPACPMRMAGDLSAVADPGTGVSFYNTLGASGWGVVGGTSAATPLTAAALTALGIANGHFTPAWVWQNPVDFYDVTTGDNGSCGDGGAASYVCAAGPGYDGPTGWGTPNGNLLSTALPPGTTGGTCASPVGSYGQSCAGCVVGMRTTGCALTCQSCTKIDGTQNLGPTLGLPCNGDVSNDDGTLVCNEAPDAGSADAGDAGKKGDAGLADASAPAMPGEDAAVHDGGSDPSPDATSGSDAPVAGESATLPGSSGGCGCVTSATRVSSPPAALGLGLALVLARRRRKLRG